MLAMMIISKPATEITNVYILYHSEETHGRIVVLWPLAK